MPKLNLARSSLLVVDCQEAFSELRPKELPVKGALKIVPKINRLLKLDWKRIDATQDWHPPDHASFLGQRDNVYPPHAVMDTPGANFLPGLDTHRFQAIWRKGFQRHRDAYDVVSQHPEFIHLLQASGVKTVVICGLTTNICCYYNALALRRGNFAVWIVEDASAGIDIPTLGLYQAQAKQEAQSRGVKYVKTAEVVRGP
ncbi:MAG: isochorismatase family protein [Gemmataceae bacterium]